MRRDPKAIVTAHQMDPARRDLYVEGPTDRQFLQWLVPTDEETKTRILEIAGVDTESVERGGERGRLLFFAKVVVDESVAIRCFADADYDVIWGNSVPENVWLTDCRDLEGYVLRDECIEKLVELGWRREGLDARELSSRVRRQCRCLGELRLASHDRDLELPFQSTRLRRYVSYNIPCNEIALNRRGYLRTLLQNAGISLNQLNAVDSAWREAGETFDAWENRQVIHGKDAFAILSVVADTLGRSPDVATALFTSFERRWVDEYETLARVRRYLVEGTVDAA